MSDFLSVFLSGVKVTLIIFMVTLLLAIPFGLIVALIRRSQLKWLNKIMVTYIWIMRGTPLMLQILFIHYYLPTIGISFPPLISALVAFALNYTAYFAEIFRGGIQAVPKGQYEAAKTLGMTRKLAMFRIILPQMWKQVIPAISNETITLVKDTSLVYIIALRDVLTVVKSLVSRDFSFTPFFFAAIFYLVMCLILTWLFNRLERYYARYDD